MGIQPDQQFHHGIRPERKAELERDNYNGREQSGGHRWDGLTDVWVDNGFGGFAVFAAGQTSALKSQSTITITGIATHQATAAIGTNSFVGVFEISPYLTNNLIGDTSFAPNASRQPLMQRQPALR